MFVSSAFLVSEKEMPSDATIDSHKLLIKGGFIMPIASGLYNWLTPGFIVMEKIKSIIRNEMKSIGCSEILMPCIQMAEAWERSGRYEDYGKEMLRINDRHGRKMLFGPTNEEIATLIFDKFIKSYKQLPVNFFHIQWKFRDEIRPRFGLLRAREFLMKDGYSFDYDKESAIETYNKFYQAYLRIFEKIGIKVVPIKTKDSGPIGGDLNHEFHICADSGDDKIRLNSEMLDISIDEFYKKIKSEIFHASLIDKEDELTSKEDQFSSIEVGHIFYFGTKYSQSMNVKFINSQNVYMCPHMGSYGIGVSRLIAAIVDSSNDSKGIIWPNSIAPFLIYIIEIKVCAERQQIYDFFQLKGIDIIYDDTKDSYGKKISNADLMGVPWKIIIGKAWESEKKIELKSRGGKDYGEKDLDEALGLVLERQHRENKIN